MNFIPDLSITRILLMKTLLLSLSLSLSLALPLHAQAPGTDIFDQSRDGLRIEQNAISDQARKLHSSKKMLTLEATIALLETPAPLSLTLPAPKFQKLTPTEIAHAAQLSNYRVGWAYLCNNCDNWHINLAGGYAITDDGVIATCSHVVNTDRKKMREGSLIAVDHTGKVHPITSIIADHDKIDGALLKIDAKTIPLPLNDQISSGDSAFCFSRPLKQGHYFTQGIVNRFFWNDNGREKNNPTSLKSLGALKLNVSTRWAPGSSGSAVLDSFGNAIGHVSTISTMGNQGNRNDDTKAGRTLITLHTATPARAMKALALTSPKSPSQ